MLLHVPKLSALRNNNPGDSAQACVRNVNSVSCTNFHQPALVRRAANYGAEGSSKSQSRSAALTHKLLGWGRLRVAVCTTLGWTKGDTWEMKGPSPDTVQLTDQKRAHFESIQAVCQWASDLMTEGFGRTNPVARCPVWRQVRSSQGEWTVLRLLLGLAFKGPGCKSVIVLAFCRYSDITNISKIKPACNGKKKRSFLCLSSKVMRYKLPEKSEGR